MSEDDTSGVRKTARTEVWAAKLSDVWDVGVVVLNPDGGIDFANSQARALLQADDDAQLADRWREAKGAIDPARHAASAGAATPTEATISLDEDGVETFLRAQVYTVDEDECAAHLVLLQHAGRAAAIDASFRHAAQDRGLASLYQDLAHDLKSVLNVIGLNLTLLSRAAAATGAPPPDPQRILHSGEVMRRELKRLDHAIDLILDRSLVERHRPESFDLSVCCDRIARLTAARAARQHVTVRVDVPPRPVMIDGFADRLQVALLNLVVNALDAMQDGGTLELRLWQDAEATYLRVADTGPGVDDDTLPHLWKLHHTTKPAGTGIGLHVTRATVESHGGRITYHRGEGGTGATFTSVFPHARDGRH